MNNYEDWAQLVAKKLKGEADLFAAIENDELDDAAATEAFSRAVLQPFLPENFGIGSGRIADAFGNYSDPLDIVVYNRDFPRIGMRGAQKAYLYESVLAAFAIRGKFVRKTFFDALNACASLSELNANIDKTVLVRLAKKNGLTLGPNKKFIHRDPLHTARFDLIGRPPAFVFGFSGIKYSYKQLQENIELWLDNRQQDGMETEMCALPAVIATQGCFAWRNAAPLALSNREMLGIGNDDAPIRLIVLQLLYLLNRRLNVTADGYGLKPNLKAYLSQFAPPKFEVGAGTVAEVVNLKKSEGAGDDARPFAQQTRSSLYVPAEDRASRPEPAASAPAPRPAPVAEKPPAPKPAAEPRPAAEPDSLGSGAAQFDKPSPFASAPTPAPQEEQAPAPAAEPAAPSSGAGVFDKPSPFASAPIPTPKDEPTAQPEPPRAPMGSSLGSAPIPMDKPAASEPRAENRPAAAPLGSAPIPPADSRAYKPPATTPLGSAPIPPTEQPKANVIPPKPPVDIELDLGADSEAPAQDLDDAEEDEFSQTVVIPPPNAAEKKTEPPRNSTDAFIARVKQQLSNSEYKPETEQDSFTSTIPQ